MNENRRRPTFRPRKEQAAPESPEDLFLRTKTKQPTHAYLRGPQQDVLRRYMEVRGASVDIGLELPTGTGKTLVGLLIAEFERLTSKEPVAYLATTNQLAGQVLHEARQLGIAVADLRGGAGQRDAATEGRFRAADAVAVTSYANLFNSRPVLDGAGTLVFDDAHTGSGYLANLWELRIPKNGYPQFYADILALLAPCMSEQERARLSDRRGYASVVLVDLPGNDALREALRAKLDDVARDGDLSFSWREVRASLHACIVLVSPLAISIRPYLFPTHAHGPFAQAKKRVYMSATLGSAEDLMRAYSVDRVAMITAEHRDEGTRFYALPGLYGEEAAVSEFLRRMWTRLDPRRMVLMSPSHSSLERRAESLAEKLDPTPEMLDITDIERSLAPFSSASNVLLKLAGRYDGLDLKQDTCRCLLLWGSPGALDELERELRDHWQMGPILLSRKLVRFVQGSGRCTRDATDYAVIVLLGDDLIKDVTAQVFQRALPRRLGAELLWGKEQSKLIEHGAEGFVEMLAGVLEDSDYRADAEESIEGWMGSSEQEDLPDRSAQAKAEVKFSRRLWDGEYEGAYEQARILADSSSAENEDGYRALAWYLASIAAHLAGEAAKERDALTRAASCSVNVAWLKNVARARVDEEAGRIEAADIERIHAKRVLDNLGQMGWAGPRFETKVSELLGHLEETAHARFHSGLRGLGRLLGAAVPEESVPGSPDCVWSFEWGLWATFEAKSEKKLDGNLNKEEVLQAKGHVNWVRDKFKLSGSVPIKPIVVSPTLVLTEEAVPHASGLWGRTVREIRDWAAEVIAVIREARTNLLGLDEQVQIAGLVEKLRAKGLGSESIRTWLLSAELAPTLSEDNSPEESAKDQE